MDPLHDDSPNASTSRPRRATHRTRRDRRVLTFQQQLDQVLHAPGMELPSSIQRELLAMQLAAAAALEHLEPH